MKIGFPPETPELYRQPKWRVYKESGTYCSSARNRQPLVAHRYTFRTSYHCPYNIRHQYTSSEAEDFSWDRGDPPSFFVFKFSFKFFIIKIFFFVLLYDHNIYTILFSITDYTIQAQQNSQSEGRLILYFSEIDDGYSSNFWFMLLAHSSVESNEQPH